MGPSDMVTPRERMEGFSAKIRELTANVNELRR
jgi:hypothetical protein